MTTFLAFIGFLLAIYLVDRDFCRKEEIDKLIGRADAALDDRQGLADQIATKADEKGFLATADRFARQIDAVRVQVLSLEGFRVKAETTIANNHFEIRTLAICHVLLNDSVTKRLIPRVEALEAVKHFTADECQEMLQSVEYCQSRNLATMLRQAADQVEASADFEATAADLDSTEPGDAEILDLIDAHEATGVGSVPTGFSGRFTTFDEAKSLDWSTGAVVIDDPIAAPSSCSVACSCSD